MTNKPSLALVCVAAIEALGALATEATAGTALGMLTMNLPTSSHFDDAAAAGAAAAAAEPEVGMEVMRMLLALPPLLLLASLMRSLSFPQALVQQATLRALSKLPGEQASEMVLPSLYGLISEEGSVPALWEGAAAAVAAMLTAQELEIRPRAEAARRFLLSKLQLATVQGGRADDAARALRQLCCTDDALASFYVAKLGVADSAAEAVLASLAWESAAPLLELGSVLCDPLSKAGRREACRAVAERLQLGGLEEVLTALSALRGDKPEGAWLLHHLALWLRAQEQADPLFKVPPPLAASLLEMLDLEPENISVNFLVKRMRLKGEL